VSWAASPPPLAGSALAFLYCVTPRARAQTRSVNAAQVAIACQCPWQTVTVRC